MNVATIRDGFKTRLETVSGLRAFDTFPAGEIPVPAAVVLPSDPFITYPETIAPGICTLNFRVTLLASFSSDRTGQDTIDAYLSAGTGQTLSVVDALRGDRTLGGAAQTLVIESANDYGITEVAGNQYVKADLLVTVTSRRA